MYIYVYTLIKKEGKKEGNPLAQRKRFYFYYNSKVNSTYILVPLKNWLLVIPFSGCIRMLCAPYNYGSKFIWQHLYII